MPASVTDQYLSLSSLTLQWFQHVFLMVRLMGFPCLCRTQDPFSLFWKHLLCLQCNRQRGPRIILERFSKARPGRITGHFCLNRIVTDWLEIRDKATPTCKGDWEKSTSFEPRRKEVVYEHLDRLCNPESSTHTKEKQNRTTNFNLRWVVKGSEERLPGRKDHWVLLKKKKKKNHQKPNVLFRQHWTWEGAWGGGNNRSRDLQYEGLPWRRCSKESTCQGQRRGSDPWPRKMPRARSSAACTQQKQSPSPLGPACPTSQRPGRPNQGSHRSSKEPACSN